jgi:hypothetical protein
MYDPDVIFSIHGDSDYCADHPMIGQRFRPQWVDFESGSLNGGGFNRGALIDQWNSDEDGGKCCAGKVSPLHASFLDGLGYDTRFGSA